MAFPFDLTGVWGADDGAIYYVRQLDDGTVVWAGLQASGWYQGMGFSNVFWGKLSADGKTISGNWADVPRGEHTGSGKLALDVVPVHIVVPPPLPPLAPFQLRQRPAQTTGGFGAKTWTMGTAHHPPSGLSPQDIENVEHRVQRYDVPLGENNPPCRDFSVLWGTVSKLSGPSYPTPRDYHTFVAGDWSGDGDFDFNLTPQFDRMDPQFWTAGWLNKTVHDLPPNEYILRRFDGHGEVFHCEVPMFARQNDSGHWNDPPVFLLPGWFESGGNSVLLNGRPINGNITPAGTSPNLTFTFTVGVHPPQKLVLANGTLVRVTGVMADDVGHGGDNAAEVHPVYAIDIVQDFTKRPKAQTLGAPNLTGVWHSDDQGTYYLREIGSTLWWFGLSCDQGRTFANVFHGTVSGNSIQGNWADVPVGTVGTRSAGTLSLAMGGGSTSLELLRLVQTGFFSGRAWEKLYDTPTGVVIGPIKPTAATTKAKPTRQRRTRATTNRKS